MIFKPWDRRGHPSYRKQGDLADARAFDGGNQRQYREHGFQDSYSYEVATIFVGGDSEAARKLRQAIAIAVDFEEYISIFLNGRGIAAQSMLPPGIFGHRGGDAGVNPLVYDITPEGPRRKPISEARRLLAEAGYPEGRDIDTGKPLVLYFDTTATGPDDKARLDWLRKQFARLDIQLVIRGTDYNRFQDKMRKGTAQIYQWGWNADYPDPENFMFLLYGPNSKVEHNGENASNYSNAGYDRLFEQMKNMDNTPERLCWSSTWNWSSKSPKSEPPPPVPVGSPP